MVRIRSPIFFMAIVAVLTLALAAPAAFAQPVAGGTLDPLTIPKYVTPLVIPPVMNNDGAADSYDIAVRQFQQQILPGGIWAILNPAITTPLPATTIWSYGPAADPLPDSSALGGGVGIAPAPNSQFNYPAYTFETKSNVPVDVRWINDLKSDFGAGEECLPHLLPIDQTLHWANPPMDCRVGDPRTDCAGVSQAEYEGPVPIITHVHGAHVDPHSDGYPEAWWLPACDLTPFPGYATKGTLFDDSTGLNPGNLGYADFSYRQDQPATTLWYHDHTLGMTRSNVYAGPAGFWLIRGGMYDKVKVANGNNRAANLPSHAPSMGQSVLELNLPTNIRKRVREIPIVIQDRSFDLVKANGTKTTNPAEAVEAKLFYPDNRAFFEGLNPAGTNGGVEELQINFVPNSDIAPIWNPEAFFNVMVVNGVSWPVLEVAPAKYRFRFLNGSNSRFLVLKLTVDPRGDNERFNSEDLSFWQIGAEQGFLDEPVPLNFLLMGLAERADVIVDFSDFDDGDAIYLVNDGPDAPFGAISTDDLSDHATTGQVMKFTINDDLLVPEDRRTTDPVEYVLNAEGPLGTSTVTRQVSLNELDSEIVCVKEDNGNLVQLFCEAEDLDGVCENVDDPIPPESQLCEDKDGEPFGPKEALLGTVTCFDDDPVPGVEVPCNGLYDRAEGNPLKWTDDSDLNNIVKVVTLESGATVNVNVTENPDLGATEVWEMFNFTADAHPIHLHLVRFEVVGREVIGGGTSIAGTNEPLPWEMGFKDTVISYPGEVTRIKALFDIAGLYVWHCHIVEHEDNEMMRPYTVGLPTYFPPAAPAGEPIPFGFGGL